MSPDLEALESQVVKLVAPGDRSPLLERLVAIRGTLTPSWSRQGSTKRIEEKQNWMPVLLSQYLLRRLLHDYMRGWRVELHLSFDGGTLFFDEFERVVDYLSALTIGSRRALRVDEFFCCK